MDIRSMGETIARLRKTKDITQKQLADQLGITDQAVSKWENGGAYPDITLLPTLADLLDVTVDELIRQAPESSSKATMKEQLRPLVAAISKNIEQLLFMKDKTPPIIGLHVYLKELRSNNSGTWTLTSTKTPDSVAKADSTKAATFMSPFGNDQQVRIIQSLLFEPKPAELLMDELSLSADQLHHHLRELAKAGHLSGKQNTYTLTDDARTMAFIVFGWVTSNKAYSYGSDHPLENALTELDIPKFEDRYLRPN